jgi:pimeloyl-ACP methyl ester carboxylesterase
LSTPVLLLHGQPGSARDWERVIGELGHRRAVAFDRPGWDGVHPPTDLDGNARAAIAELDVHGIDRAIAVGHSFGGAVAAWLAASNPHRVAGLVLVAPSANVASMYRLDQLLARPVAGPFLSGLLLGTAGWALGLRSVRRALPGDDGYLRSVARRLRSPAAWRTFVFEQRALFTDLPALEGMLWRIQAPTRIIGGSADRVVPSASLSQLAASIGGSQLDVLPGAGHLFPLQRPRVVADEIESVDGYSSPG